MCCPDCSTYNVQCAEADRIWAAGKAAYAANDAVWYAATRREMATHTGLVSDSQAAETAEFLAGQNPLISTGCDHRWRILDILDGATAAECRECGLVSA